MNMQRKITPERIDAQIAASERDRMLARRLLKLGELCIRAAGRAGMGRYEDMAIEAEVTDAAYDLFEADALYERVRDIDPGFYERREWKERALTPIAAHVDEIHRIAGGKA